MLTFKTALVAKALPDGIFWELHDPLIIDLGLKATNDLLIIPKGFRTDFGSIPTVLQWLVSTQGKGKRSFVMHDYLYRKQLFTQLVSDALLNEGMIVDGVNWFQRFLVYRGLRIGGWFTYDKYTKAIIKT